MTLWRTSSVATLQGLGYTACAPYNGAQWALGADGAVCLNEGSRERTSARVSRRLPSAGRPLYSSGWWLQAAA